MKKIIIFVLITAVIIGAAILWGLLSGPGPTDSLGVFLETKEEVADLMDKISAASEVDLSPLEALDEKGDYEGALKLLDKAVKQNSSNQEIMGALILKTNEMQQAAQALENETLRAKALEVVNLINQANTHQKNYFQNLLRVYSEAVVYFSARGLGKEANISDDVQTYTQKAEEEIIAMQELTLQIIKSSEELNNLLTQ
jgi:hypothetical protein